MTINEDKILNNKRVLIKFFIKIKGGDSIPVDSPSKLIDFVLNIYKCSNRAEFIESLKSTNDTTDFYSLLKSSKINLSNDDHINALSFIEAIQIKIMIDNSYKVQGTESNELISSQIEHFKNYYIYDPNTKKRCVSMCLSLFEYITNKEKDLNIISFKELYNNSVKYINKYNIKEGANFEQLEQISKDLNVKFYVYPDQIDQMTEDIFLLIHNKHCYLLIKTGETDNDKRNLLIDRIETIINNTYELTA